MRLHRTGCIALTSLSLLASASAGESFAWPDGQAMAVSLSYDDAINSQLDNALPALNRHGLKASFYLTLASPIVLERLEEWRAAAAEGHELGNHTIYHPCSKSIENRFWVADYYDIDKYVVEEIVHEATVANTVLHAIDGETQRTYTPPCNDVVVSGESYIPEMQSLFIAIKGYEQVEPGFAVLIAPAEVSGEELIDQVKAEAARGTKLFNILMHGVGGDYLAITAEAHEELLTYLADNPDVYWVDNYRNIMTYVNEQRAAKSE